MTQSLEIVGPAELRKGEDEGKTGGNWGEKGQVRVILGFFPGIFNAVFL